MVDIENITEEKVLSILETIMDPEVPVLSIVDLGIVRKIEIYDAVTKPPLGGLGVFITPTYTGCPAMDVINMNIRMALLENGFTNIEIKTVLSPAWTTDWMTDDGRSKLADFGIAPPTHRAPTGPVALTLGRRTAVDVRCPQCGAPGREQNRFGSTSCKALYICTSCAEPFDHFKAI